MIKDWNLSRTIWSIMLAVILLTLLVASFGCTRTVYVPAPQQPVVQQPVVQQPVQNQTPATMPPIQNPAATSNRLWVYADPPVVSPYGDFDLRIIGLTPGSHVKVTIYGSDGKIHRSLTAFSEWDGDTDIEIHPYGWPNGSYRAVCQDVVTGIEGEVTFTVTGTPSPHHYYDYDDHDWDDYYDYD